jgi:metal-responsive CopG/Arc/MetJ family transcriptional regulator
MRKTAKVAVSIPDATLRAVERARRKLGSSRSAIVTEALEEWLARRALGGKDATYVEGYRRRPETPDEVAATEAIAVDAMSGWEPWE